MTFLRIPLVVITFSALAFGCQPAIGDSCSNGTDCSVNGDRVCDLAQPEGYCTIRGCDGNACPESSICVEFRGDPARTAETWCMQSCTDDGSCRTDYACLMPNDSRLTDLNGSPISEILDSNVADNVGFCTALAQ